jgi:hypothetical protein
MKSTYLLALMLVAGMTLAACSSQTNPTPPATRASAAATATPGAEGEPAAKAESARLMGGYVPTFSYRLRSQRHQASGDGKYQHIVIVEYLDVDDAEIGDILRRDLEGRGLAVRGPAEHSGAQRYVAQNSRVGRMFADINAEPQLALGKRAQGTIYFSWQDDEQR